MFNIEKPAVTGSTATGETKLPNSLDKLSESQKLATEKKGMQSKIPFLLVIPSIAQDLLNSGSIVIDAATVLQPQNDSVLLSIASHIYVPGPFTVQTEPTQGQLYVPQIGSAYPMAQLNLPGMRIHKNTNIRATSQYTVFENYTSWQSFVPDTIFLNTGGLGLKGKIITQLGNIKKFSLDIPSNGLFLLPSLSLGVLVSSLDSIPGFLMSSIQD
ncbi:hypothetical protein EIK77_007884 [Talaromyces pinophilus]|nr:hypothetical protein EIK77_007884 [Talaromyces pinophilus]